MKKLFVISGSSGVGKGTLLAKFLEKNKNFKLSVSCTTRGMRPGEVDGKSYHFMSREEFESSVQNGDFVEWAEFSGNLYGTNKRFVEKSLDDGDDVILEIETQGALQIKEKIQNAVLIFVLPPSLEVLEQRLRGRGTESDDAIKKRMDFITMESENSELYDYKIVNDDIDVAVEELESVILYEKNRTD